MGITYNTFKALRWAKDVAGVKYTRTCTLGHQLIGPKLPEKIRNLIGEEHYPLLKQKGVNGQAYADEIFKWLGAEHIDSCDYSDYEGATLIHDMNTPVPKELYGRFSAILDGGTLEHVYNFPQSISNISKMVEMGGHLLFVTQADGWLGHGFYQFSPELFYSIFCERNGFAETKVFYSDRKGNYFYVRSPEEMGDRVSIVPRNFSGRMFVIARKVSEVTRFIVQQSDYETKWQKESKLVATVGRKELMKRLYYSNGMRPVQRVLNSLILKPNQRKRFLVLDKSFV